MDVKKTEKLFFFGGIALLVLIGFGLIYPFSITGMSTYASSEPFDMAKLPIGGLFIMLAVFLYLKK